MLRNKIGKPSQPTTNNQANKTSQTKPTTIPLPNTLGVKAPLGTNPVGGFGGIKTPSLIGVKPSVNPTANKLTTTLPQSTIPTMAKKQITQTHQPSQTTTQHKPIRPQQIKSQQERLAELVTKKAAQMKKQYHMINKISSQVGSQRKSYVKEYQARFGHVLKVVGKGSRLRNKENQSHGEIQAGKNKKSIVGQISGPLWKVNEWDLKGSIKGYMANFTADKYM